MSATRFPFRPRVTIIVPVHNRGDQLARLLESLGQLRFPRSEVEILICDDGSTEDLLGVIQEGRERAGLAIHHLRQDRRGAGAARNLGLKAASAEITAFTDSDCEVAAGWLEGLLAPFEDPEVGIVGGPVLPHRNSPLVAQCANWIMSSPWGGGARDPRSPAAMKYYPRAGNAAVRTALARNCGGFPEARHGEDVSFSHRVVSNGTRAVFSETAVVYHNEQRSLPQVFAEAFRKGRARVRLWRSRGAMESIHGAPALLVLYLLMLLAIAVAVPRTALFAGIPLVAYLLALLLIGCQAVARLRRVAAFVTAPSCACLMHAGYGIGLLSAAVPGWRPPAELSEMLPKPIEAAEGAAVRGVGVRLSARVHADG